MRQTLLFLAWLIALTAMLSTLYGSEIQHLPICHLCWYQRICFYPLVIILGIGAYQNDVKAIAYSLPFSFLAIVFSGYQVLIQAYPQLEAIGVCGQGPSCSDTHIKLFGFVTYAMLSLAASLITSGLLVTGYLTRTNK